VGRCDTGQQETQGIHMTKSAGPQFNLLPDAEPMDYFSLFFNEELLINIIIEANR
jgi:hypothetical protein